MRVNIRLGKMLDGSERPVFFKAQPFFVMGVFSKSRTGKTSNVKNILVRYKIRYWQRPLIIFDPYSEYYKIGRFNTQSRMANKVGNLLILRNFALPLHLFDQQSDWYALGISDMGARWCAEIAKRLDIHLDDPERFCDILGRLPDDFRGVDKFNDEFNGTGLHFTKPLPQSVTQSLSNKLITIKGYFKSEKDGRVSLHNIRDLVVKYNVIIDFGLGDGGSEEKAKADTGVILRLIKPVLGFRHPVIVFDEADKFCPNLFGTDILPPASLHEIEELVIKLQRLHIGLIFITQDEKLISNAVRRNLSSLIVGKLDPDSKYWHYSEGLYWDVDRGIRQFVFVDVNWNAYPFAPDEPDCEV